LNNERGFTLAELLVACAIIGFVMAGIFTLQQQGQSAYLWGSARVEVQQNARLALDLMTRELRSAQSVTTMGANCNNATGATTITFVDSGSTTITYTLSGTILQRTVTATTSDVTAGVETFRIFCYRSDGYSFAAAAADIRSITVQIGTRTEANPAAGQAGAQHAHVESRVKLRNL